MTSPGCILSLASSYVMRVKPIIVPPFGIDSETTCLTAELRYVPAPLLSDTAQVQHPHTILSLALDIKFPQEIKSIHTANATKWHH